MTGVASAFRLRDGKPQPLPPVHLEGMGVMGCLVGELLVHLGIDFTWSDNESREVAWGACTGVVYPSGHALDNENLASWHTNSWCCRAWRELGRWTYFSKNPPHGGRGECIGQVGGVRVSSHHSLHFNAQSMVLARRVGWSGNRTPDRMPGQLKLITHGFDPRTLHRWSWGWSARVKLDLAPALVGVCQQRPALYMRDGYILDYAYPIPGQPDLWYAGTALHTQRKPKALSVLQHFERWAPRFRRKVGAALVGLEVGRMEQGWRPVPAEGAPLVYELGDEWAIRPQYGSAFRHWWTTAAALTAKLEGALVHV